MFDHDAHETMTIAREPGGKLRIGYQRNGVVTIQRTVHESNQEDFAIEVAMFFERDWEEPKRAPIGEANAQGH